MVPKPQNPDPGPLNRSGPFIISFALLRNTVSPSIKLNRQPRVVAIKIQNIPAEWMLPSEFNAAKATVAQNIPEQLLGIGESRPQFPRIDKNV